MKKGRVLSEKDEKLNTYEKVLITSKKANLKKYAFNYRSNKLPRPKNVYLVGSFFGDWEMKHRLNFDFFSQKWSINLHLPNGQYLYKFNFNLYFN